MRNRKAVLIVLALGLLLGACSKSGNIGDSIPTAPGGQSTDNLAIARFAEGVTPTAAFRFSSDHGVRIVAYQHTIEIGGEQATAFLPAYPNENSSQLANRWEQAYTSFVKSTAGVLQQMPLADKTEFSGSTDNLARSFAATAQNPPVLSGKFDALIISASPEKLAQLKSDATVDLMEAPPNTEPRSADPSSALSTQAACYVPSAGRTITQSSPYYSGQREAYNYFGWSSVCFINNATFELDFVLKATGGTYLDATTLAYGFPRYEYAVTNQPYAYLDSRSGDNLNEVVAYTLGCAYATALRAGTTYYTYWRTRNGTASVDNALVTAELGHNICGVSTWCSGWNAVRTIITPNWGISVPGTRNW